MEMVKMRRIWEEEVGVEDQREERRKGEEKEEGDGVWKEIETLKLKLKHFIWSSNFNKKLHTVQSSNTDQVL